MYRISFYSIVLLASAAVLVGCGLSETVVTTGIVGQNAKNQVEALNNIKFRANPEIAENNVRRAVSLFEAGTGLLPHSLDELVEKGYLDVMPALPEGYEFDYNPFTGTVKTRRALSRPQISVPQLPPEQDSWDAAEYIRKYEQQSQTSPYVAPSQSDRQPSSARWRAMQRQTRRASGRARGGGGAGVGPMGEVMGGIAIQNELNSMSGSGTSSAGTYSRRILNRNMQQHQRRQQQAFRDLGH